MNTSNRTIRDTSYVQVDPTTVSLLICNGCGALVRALHMSLHIEWHKALATLGDPAEQPTNGDVEQLRDTITSLRIELIDIHTRTAGLSRGETNRLRQVEEVLLELGAPGPHAKKTPTAGPMIAWLREKLGRYTWRPGDPPPPAYIRVLLDIDEEDSSLRYLCRVGSSNDWQWMDHPDHAYSGPALTWEAVAGPDSDHVLVQVPGGDV